MQNLKDFFEMACHLIEAYLRYAHIIVQIEKEKMQNIIKVIICLSISLIAGCSTSPQLTSINTNSVSRVGLIPSLPDDIIDVYYKRYDYPENKNKVINNVLIYYFSEDTSVIKKIIDDLKGALPSQLSTMGAMYGIPNFFVIVDSNGRHEKISITPTAGIEKVFFQNKNKLQPIILIKYLMKIKEKGLALLEELDDKGIQWHIQNVKNKNKFNHSLLLKFSSKVSHKETENHAIKFLNGLKNLGIKFESEKDEQFSNAGFPISVHLFVSSTADLEKALIFCKKENIRYFYRPEPLEVYIDNQKINQSLSTIINKYNLINTMGF